MSDFYISDIENLYNNNESINKENSVINPLQYRWIKAYPSVNSTNGGSINSEENLRWLTKQFTKKSFIIPRPPVSEIDKFDFDDDASNRGRTAGGMANIDGYIFNIANDISKMSYDSTGDTYIATNDIGYVDYQNLQFVQEHFMKTDENNAISNNIDDYLYKDYKFSKFNWAATWKKLYEDSILNPSQPIEVGEITLYYDEIITDKIIKSRPITIDDDDKIEYNEIEYNETVDDSDSDNTIHTSTAKYTIYYGYPDNDIILCDCPVIYFKDLFGFIFIFDNDLTISSSSYPGSQSNCINAIDDKFTPDTPDFSNVLNTTFNSKIYDFTKMYESTTVNNREVYIRNDNSSYEHPTNDYRYELSHYLSHHFETHNRKSLYETYTRLTNDTTFENVPEILNNLTDEYYCLPVKLIDDSLQIKYEVDGVTYSIPISFMNSSGMLTPTNIYADNTSSDIPIVEGYVSFIRRICKQMVIKSNDNDSEEQGLTNSEAYLKFGDLSDVNTHSNAWTKLYKYIEKHGVNNTYFVRTNNIQSLFNVADISEIKFNTIYNLLIAPYVNFYMIASLSALLNISNNQNKYKPINSGNKFSSTEVVEDLKNKIIYSRDDIDIELPNDNSRTISQTVTYQKHNNTDFERFENTSKINKETISNISTDIFEYDGIFYYKPSTMAKTTNQTYKNAIQSKSFEDYITYIKKCAILNSTKYNSENSEKSNAICIPYIITSIDTDTDNNNGASCENNYGFTKFNHFVDRYIDNYTNTTVDDTNLSPCNGYIQNVLIDLNTLLPDRDTIIPYDVEILKQNEQYINFNYSNDAQHKTVPKDYSVWLGKNYGADINGQIFKGINGFTFNMKSQGWVTNVPMVFQLHKNSQNHLLGKDKSTTEHAGIQINFKLPIDVELDDLWFTNIWLSNLTTVTAWETEANTAHIPTNTDGMRAYLNLRNLSIFPTTAIYHETSNGITSLVDFIYSMFDEGPSLKYSDHVSRETVSYVSNVYSGLISNIKRLKQYIDDTTWTVSYIEGAGSNTETKTINIKNNQYLTLTHDNGYDYEETHNTNITNLIINAPIFTNDLIYPNDSTFSSLIDFNTGVNTNGEYNHVFSATIRIPFKKICKIRLDTKMNPKTQNDSDARGSEFIQTIWDSNYPLKTVHVEADSTHVSYDYYELIIQDYDNEYVEKDVSDALLELKIVPKLIQGEDCKLAYGYCNVSLLANPNTLTLPDNSYLLKVLYSNIENLTWHQIHEITKFGLAHKLWHTGETKKFIMSYSEVVDGEEINVSYEVPATIIGFNQDFDNGNTNYTVTWLTNMYNNVIPETDEVLYKTFNVSYGTTDEYRNNVDNITNGYVETEVYRWLSTDNPKGVESYIEPALTDIIIPIKKNSGILYLKNADGVIQPIVDRYTNERNSVVATKYWLPSLYELGLKCEDVDRDERNVLINETRNENPDVLQYESLRINNLDDDEFVISDTPNNCYPYFKKNKNEQNVKSLTLLCRSFYAVYDVDNTNNYNNIPRHMHCVGTGFNKEFSEGRWLSVLDKNSVYKILENNVPTDFCFTTC